VDVKVYLTMVRVLSELESKYFRSQSMISSEISFCSLMFSLKMRHILNNFEQ